MLVLSENYPKLKADTNFRALFDELGSTEKRLALARKEYNESVQIYNTRVRSLPLSLFARALGVSPKDYF